MCHHCRSGSHVHCCVEHLGQNQLAWVPVLEPQVDWKAPRPVREFLQPNTFLPPKSFSKWEARVKNNLYYYRSNYAVLLVLSFTCCFLRNPWALVALSITGFGILCLNDPTATALK